MKKLLGLLATAVCLLCSIGLLVACNGLFDPDHEHTLVKHNATEATCLVDGNTAYWACEGDDGCGKFFSDEAGEHEIAANSWVTKGTHSVSEVAAVEGDCKTPGHISYYECGVCHKKFDSAALTRELDDEDVLQYGEHDLSDIHAYKAATCDEDGNLEYYHCVVCDKYFEDEFGENEYDENEWLLPAAHTLTETAAVAADCATYKDGNIAYSYCSVCKKYFDGDGEQIEEGDWVTPYAHTLTEEAAQEADCATYKDGHEAFYTCSTCHKHFDVNDPHADAEHEIDESGAVTHYEHNLTQTPAVAANCGTFTDGNSDYWHCSKCGKYYDDESATAEHEIEEGDWVVPYAHAMDEGHEAKESTCNVKGNVAYWHCDTCNQDFDVADANADDGHVLENVSKPFKAHQYSSSDKCDVCGLSKNPFVLTGDDDAGYTITGFAETDKGTANLVIPAETNDGKKIVAVAAQAFDGFKLGELAIESITIDADLTSIGNYAFRNLPHLKTVTIDGNIGTIGDYAFAQNSADNPTVLDTVTINGDIDSCGTYMFQNTAVKTAILHGAITTGGNYMFNSCNSLVSVDLGTKLTYIPQSMFSKTLSLETVTIPASVKEIQSYAFDGGNTADASGNMGLTSIVIPASVETLGEYVFRWCDKLTHIEWTEGLQTIGNNVFLNCKLLSELPALPASVTTLGNAVFSGIGAVESYTIPATVTKIGSDLFKNSGIKKCVFQTGESVTEINGFFSGCESLTDVTLTQYMTLLGNSAFNNCKALKHLDLRYITKIVNNSSNQFYGTNLEWIIVAASLSKNDSWIKNSSNTFKGGTVEKIYYLSDDTSKTPIYTSSWTGAQPDVYYYKTTAPEDEDNFYWHEEVTGTPIEWPAPEL